MLMRPVQSQTVLVRGKQPQALIVAPADGAFAKAAVQVQQLVRETTGTTLPIVTPSEVTGERGVLLTPEAKKRNLVFVGNLAVNPALFEPYMRRTLVADGLLEERERVILADFANHSQDSLLGGAVTEAFRVDLAQSPSIRLLAPDQMRDAMVRMRREPGSPLGQKLARELAAREGVKAVIGGEVNTLGCAVGLNTQ